MIDIVIFGTAFNAFVKVIFHDFFQFEYKL